MKTTNYFKLYIGLFLVLLCSACEDFVELDPPNSRVVSNVVFKSDELALSAMEGVYHRLFNITGFASGSAHSVTSLAGLASDEFDLYNTLIYSTLPDFRQNEIAITNTSNLNLWSSAYNTIYQTNAILEGIPASEGVTENTKKQLEGEARFVRAFSYFYLVNLFGDVPLVTTTDYDINALISKSPSSDIYRFIIEDLNISHTLLGNSYRNSVRIHPNALAASALLSRVYLYLEDWDQAEELATEVISATENYTLLQDLNQVFLANSQEAIWQITPVGTTGQTYEGSTFILFIPNFFLTPMALSPSLINSFEDGDRRLDNWVGILSSGAGDFYYPFKYKVRNTTEAPTEYSTVLRLSEQYLIRAEARAMMGNIPDAQLDLNKVRNRAGLDNATAGTAQALMDAILQERRVEFFAEWGHRWFDLKRLQMADQVLSGYKPEWQSTDVLFPIPEQELSKNPNLVQNQGY
ncbi:RagB/SusD family nutrient uptake outer membrane protein [Tenacibaculum sp.]|uniref:RagB/SusD family nutrient uptake outer membrane protein n=1 Tax=Tenacibaculum sp. TaxID=1906242 RepID=UPI003D11E0EA